MWKQSFIGQFLIQFFLLYNISLIIFSLQRRPPEVVTDLFADIRDGVKLIKLLEVLTGQKLVSCDSG